MIPRLLVAFLPLLSTVVADRSWTLEHAAVGTEAPPQWQKRGTLQLTSEGLALESSSESRLALDDKEWYQLRVQNSDGSVVLTTVPACQVRRANFR